jgi:hypothetical protein
LRKRTAMACPREAGSRLTAAVRYEGGGVEVDDGVTMTKSSAQTA